MTTLIFDTETTGFYEPVVIEAAWIQIESPCSLNFGESFCQKYNPGKPIELEALATHHLLDEELRDCPPASDFTLPPGAEYIVGHNVDYDWHVIGRPNVKRICTRALSSFLFPEIDSHSQSAMIYLFERNKAKSLLKDAHSAFQDVKNCFLVFQNLMAKIGGITQQTTWDEIWEISEKARIPRVMKFGKYKGLEISKLPSDYKRWLLNQANLDPYLLKAIA